MALKTFNPITPSRRYITQIDYCELTKKKPEKKLLFTKTPTGGRNFQGRITARFRGGGHKRKFRIIDFKRDNRDILGKVSSIEYDPNRSARIALINYLNGEKRYILSPLGLKVGDSVIASEKADIKVGNSLPLRNIPLGTTIHNVELNIGGGGKLARSAGSIVLLAGFEGEYAQLKLPSGEIRKVHKNCWATIGQVGNLDHENVIIGKAGRSRWLGIRPHNRGVSMNPVDHPLGGGEGRSKGGRHPCSPWGQIAKGLKTRNNPKTDSFIIRRRK